jgi:hypothetical protein
VLAAMAALACIVGARRAELPYSLPAKHRLLTAVDILFFRSIRKYRIHLAVSMVDSCSCYIGEYGDFTGDSGCRHRAIARRSQEIDGEQVIDTEIQRWPDL